MGHLPSKGADKESSETIQIYTVLFGLIPTIPQGTNKGKDWWVDLRFNFLNKKERIFMFAVLKNLTYYKESDNDK